MDFLMMLIVWLFWYLGTNQNLFLASISQRYSGQSTDLVGRLLVEDVSLDGAVVHHLLFLREVLQFGHEDVLRQQKHVRFLECVDVVLPRAGLKHLDFAEVGALHVDAQQLVLFGEEAHLAREDEVQERRLLVFLVKSPCRCFRPS